MTTCATISHATCEHCGTGFVAVDPRQKYCCRGCEYVSKLIHGQGLDRYYQLKEERTTAPVRSRPFEEHDYAWTGPAIEQAEETAKGGLATLDCAVEGISCVGCVWLIGRLFEQHPGAIRASANPASGQLHLEWQSRACDLEKFLKEISAFGYVAAPASASPKGLEQRLILGRLGLCGAFALNAMAFSLPAYLGMRADFEFAGLFRLIAFASASLAMFVGGGYFFARAWRALRAHTLHIDLPIALGLLAAYSGSIAGWAIGEGRLLYFDFVATFTFLMLLGRLVQTAAVEKNRQRLVRRSPLAATVQSHGQPVALADLKAGVSYLLEPGKALPVASCLVDAAAEVSLEWIRGESDAVLMEAGARMPAGAILLSRTPVMVTSDEAWADSLLSALTGPGTGDHGSPVFQRLLKVYLIVVVLVGIIAAAVWSYCGDWLTGLQAMISVFVVSCPCALGVAVPLADEIAAARLARAGAFVRRTSLWPRLRRVRHLIFDKTGTLTLERPELCNPEVVSSLNDEAALALARLTRASLHPVSRTLLEHLGGRGQQLLEEHGRVPVTEVPGSGVTCESNDHCWFLGKSQTGLTVLWKNGRLIAGFGFRDSLRPGAASAIDELKQRGLSLHIFSGDSPAKVSRIAFALGLPDEQAAGGLTPSQKASRVSDLDRRDTLYVGDGANDSLAFDAAFVTGTPVVDRSLLEAKADFYALGSGLNYLPEAFAAADARAHGIGTAFVFALLYNLTVVTLAATGHMSPLLAAIVMPLSSVVAISLVMIGARSRRRFAPAKASLKTPQP